MSERARYTSYPAHAPWLVDPHTRRPHLPGRVGDRLLGSPPPGDPRLGAGPRRLPAGSARAGAGSVVDSGRYPSPRWYRWAAGVASGGSVAAVVVVLVVRGLTG